MPGVKIIFRPTFLISLSLLLQIFNLFRNFPETQNCGRRVDITSTLSAFINCDSSVFMKDAAHPSRLIDGSSVYQDRMFYTLIAIFISRLISIFYSGRLIEVTGNSGEVFNYSTNDYAAFILINFMVLALAIWLLWKIFREQIEKSNFSKEVFATTLIFIVMNETTKTYMFTPHSQLFNVLLPVWIIYLCERSFKSSGKTWFFSVLLFTFLFSLNYKLFFIAFIPILFIGKRRAGNGGVLLTLLSLVGVMIVPRVIVASVGGTFDNYDVSHYRTVVWIFDVIRGESSPNLFILNFINLAKSFPVLPTVTTLILLILCRKWIWEGRNTPENRILFLTFLVYLSFLSILGFSARRLTLSLISIVLIWLLLLLSRESFNSGKISILIRGSIVGQLLMWTLTLGPLA